MSLHDKIQKFNRDFENKEVLGCYPLEIKTLAIGENFALPCCIPSNNNRFPQLYQGPDLLKKLDKDFYIDKYIDYFYDIQETGAACKGCCHLQKMNFKPINYDDFKIGVCNLIFFQGCNVKCVYCNDVKGELSIPKDDELVSALKRLIEQKVICDETNIAHAYGEPTIYKYFDELVNLCLSANSFIGIFSSGLLYSDSVYKALCSNKTLLNISVDSGTSETYRKVKRVDGFDIVWKNIKKYCETKGNVEVKYIVFSYNSSKLDLDGFIQKCVESNVRNVRVAAENISYYEKSDGLEWSFGSNEIDACAYLLKKCYDNNISAGLVSDYFNKEDKNRILSKYYNNMLQNDKKSSDKYCIFGFGNLGKEIYNSILDFTGIKVDFFCDNKKAGESNEFGIPIVSVEDAALIHTIKIIIPCVSRYKDEMIKQLEDLGMKDYILI